MKFHKNYILFFGAAFVAFLVLLFWIILPAVNYKEKLHLEYHRNKQRLEKILLLESEYKAKLNATGNISQKNTAGQNFSLFAFLEQRAAETGVKDNIDFMRPSTQDSGQGWRERIVEMSLNNVYLSELIPFLYTVEHADYLIQVKRVSMRSRNRDDGPLNITMVLSTVIPQ